LLESLIQSLNLLHLTIPMVMATTAILTDLDYSTLNNNHQYPDKLDFVIDNHVTQTNALGLASQPLVQEVLKERISNIDVKACDPGAEDPFYVADLGQVYRQHLRWKKNLSRVKPFYGESAHLIQTSVSFQFLT
jgi:ornithine decarboxylase